MEEATRIAIILITLLFSVIFHEMAHAWSALKMGDPTGKNDNRLSWNPIYHIDAMMTFFIPLMLLWVSGGRFVFGGAKPVKINPMNFSNPGKGMMISAAAGPLSNFLLAGASLGLLYLLVKINPELVARGKPLGVTLGGFFFLYMIFINLVLGVFNLIPIPPLDGSRVLRYLLPKDGKDFLDRIERFGLLIIIGILVLFGFGPILRPVLVLYIDFLFAIFDPEMAEAFFRVVFGK